jgi:hypothetical protein
MNFSYALIARIRLQFYAAVNTLIHSFFVALEIMDMAFILVHAYYFSCIAIYNHLGFYRVPLFLPEQYLFCFLGRSMGLSVTSTTAYCIVSRSLRSAFFPGRLNMPSFTSVSPTQFYNIKEFFDSICDLEILINKNSAIIISIKDDVEVSLIKKDMFFDDSKRDRINKINCHNLTIPLREIKRIY